MATTSECGGVWSCGGFDAEALVRKPTDCRATDEDAGGELDARVGLGALGQQHVEDVVGGAVAEELAEGLLVPGDAVLFDQREEVLRGEAGERGLGEMRVGGEEVFRRGVAVGEVAAAAAGDEDLLAGAVGVVEHEHAAAAAAGFDGAHEAGGAAPRMRTSTSVIGVWTCGIGIDA